jgi:hypothetical protein
MYKRIIYNFILFHFKSQQELISAIWMIEDYIDGCVWMVKELVAKIIFKAKLFRNREYDLSFSMSQVSKFMYASRTSHLDVINRILRYLKCTPGKKI